MLRLLLPSFTLINLISLLFLLILHFLFYNFGQKKLLIRRIVPLCKKSLLFKQHLLFLLNIKLIWQKFLITNQILVTFPLGNSLLFLAKFHHQNGILNDFITNFRQIFFQFQRKIIFLRNFLKRQQKFFLLLFLGNLQFSVVFTFRFLAAPTCLTFNFGFRGILIKIQLFLLFFII